MRETNIYVSGVTLTPKHDAVNLFLTFVDLEALLNIIIRTGTCSNWFCIFSHLTRNFVTFKIKAFYPKDGNLPFLLSGCKVTECKV